MASAEPGFCISLRLRLPRDRLSVPVARHLTEYALGEVGANRSDSDDVELALTEACTNVLAHAGAGVAYDVEISIGPSNCTISVIDLGHGFDVDAAPTAMSGSDAESGRGVAIMHDLMDTVRFASKPEGGTVVELVKRLRFDDDTPARRMLLAERK